MLESESDTSIDNKSNVDTNKDPVECNVPLSQKSGIFNRS